MAGPHRARGRGHAPAHRSAPDEVKPGFSTAEGDTLGPVATVTAWIFLAGLFGLSLAFTSVPREAVSGFVPADLSDEGAPTQVR